MDVFDAAHFNPHKSAITGTRYKLMSSQYSFKDSTIINVPCMAKILLALLSIFTKSLTRVFQEGCPLCRGLELVVVRFSMLSQASANRETCRAAKLLLVTQRYTKHIKAPFPKVCSMRLRTLQERSNVTTQCGQSLC